MLRKTLTVLLFCVVLFAQVIYPAHPAKSQGVSEAEIWQRLNSNGDACTSVSTPTLDLARAAVVNNGKYFWTFFVNFKNRVVTQLFPYSSYYSLRIYGCFVLYGRHTESSGDDTYDKFVEIGKITQRCLWTNPNNPRFIYLFKTSDLAQIAGRFNDQVSWGNTTNTTATSVRFVDQERITCRFHLENLIKKIYPPTSNMQPPNLSQDEADALKAAIDDIYVKLDGNTLISSEFYPYLTLTAIGRMRHQITKGILLEFDPDLKGYPSVSPCCQPLSLSVHDETHFSLHLNGNQFSNSQSSTPCSYSPSDRVMLVAQFKPEDDRLTSADLVGRSYITPYVVALKNLPYSGQLVDGCTPLNVQGDQPLQFWPYTTTVTIGAGFQGELYEVWVDPDDAGRK